MALILLSAMVQGGEGAKQVKVLIVGGGSSHDFAKWFNAADVAILSEGGKAAVTYTDKIDTIMASLKDIDVLYLSNNQPMANVELRKGIFDHADAGKGLLLVHPALWYNWGDWKEYNAVLVGGGSKGHDKFGEFEVTVDDAKHPIMKDVPTTFKITDELYYFIKDEKGTPIEILATGKSPLNGKTFPVVFVVKHPKTRIVAITLGHDGKAHDHPAYKTLLRNALEWVSQK